MKTVSGIRNRVDGDKFTDGILLKNSMPVPEPENPENPDTPDVPDKPEKPDTQVKTKTITIKWGDTLWALAIKYNTTVAELARINNIANPNLIYAGNKLKVPIKKEESKDDITEIYIVKRGDTLSQIALRFNVTVQEIAKQNNIKNVNLIYPGQRLIINGETCHYDCGHILHTVRKGESLWTISRRYNTTISNIVRLNRIKNPRLIYPGQTFRI